MIGTIACAQAIAATCAWLTFRDPIWSDDGGMRWVGSLAWLAAPWGVALGNLWIEENLDGAFEVAIIGGLVVLVASGLRPARLMEAAWPEEVADDEAMAKMSFATAAVVIVGTMVGLGGFLW